MDESADLPFSHLFHLVPSVASRYRTHTRTFKTFEQDPSAPKRPMSAFLLYSQLLRTTVRAEHPDLKNTDISRLLGERWKSASEEERRPFLEKEKQAREQYSKDIAEWRKKRHDEEEAMRKHRQEVVDRWMQTGHLPQYGYPWMHGPIAPPSVVQVHGQPTTILPPSVWHSYTTHGIPEPAIPTQMQPHMFTPGPGTFSTASREAPVPAMTCAPYPGNTSPTVDTDE